MQRNQLLSLETLCLKKLNCSWKGKQMNDVRKRKPRKIVTNYDKNRKEHSAFSFDLTEEIETNIGDTICVQTFSRRNNNW